MPVRTRSARPSSGRAACACAYRGGDRAPPFEALAAACDTCGRKKACPQEVQACCTMLAAVLRTRGGVEPHSCVHACRDVASRCAVRAWKEESDGWKEACLCCFSLCDALDGFCHQRIPLAGALAHKNLLCAFETGPKLPGTQPYRAAQKVPAGQECVVYCASTSCGASAAYRHGLKCAAREYPGGLLEYACRCKCGDPTIQGHKEMAKDQLSKCKMMDFNHCGTGKHHCFP